MRFRFWLFLYRVSYLMMKKAIPGVDYEFVVDGKRYIGYEMLWCWENGKIVGRLTCKPEGRV